MSATYIQDNGTGFINKLTVEIPESDMQTLFTIPFLIWTADGLNTFLPIFASLSGTPGKTPGTFTFNTLNLTDNNTLFYARLDLQQITASVLDSFRAYGFNCSTFNNGANGGTNTSVRNTFLKANANDATGTGDFTLTVLYILIPIQ
jgi:hypothetical protein